MPYAESQLDILEQSLPILETLYELLRLQRRAGIVQRLLRNQLTLLKLAGALYLVWLGLKTIREARQTFEAKAVTTGAARAFREGIVVEALNPKTAAFFLAFLPQFVDPSAGPVWLQFLVLGLISVALNTAVDVVVAMLASRARSIAVGRPAMLRRLRMAAGGLIAALGLALLFARRPVSL